MSITAAIRALKEEMQKADISAERGLGNELFLFSSTLAPVVNVDLLITNSKKQILLSWRSDPHCGSGWHIPGGCIRFKETLNDRIQKTAIAEIGIPVLVTKEPVAVFEIFTHGHRPELEDQDERAHFITLAYGCCVPDDFQIAEKYAVEGAAGSLKWFDALPADLLKVQKCYQDKWHEINVKLWR